MTSNVMLNFNFELFCLEIRQFPDLEGPRLKAHATDQSDAKNDFGNAF